MKDSGNFINPVLAIVIPAYKDTYLKKTLQSLEAQSCKAFNLYIGNDAGSPLITNIVEDFKGRLNITYHYFKENLGNKSLVKQWERCLTLIKEETWIWILPDDDYADPECVAKFYSELSCNSFDLFRYNVEFVDGADQLLKSNPPLPENQDSWDSLLEKLNFNRPSTVAEFIFNRMEYEKYKFYDIPMAWGSDDLLWYEIGHKKGIRGCNSAHVFVRQSHENISNDYQNRKQEKIDANFLFLARLLSTQEFKSDTKNREALQMFRNIAINHIMYNLQDFRLKLTIKSAFKLALKSNRIWGGGVFLNFRRFLLNNRRIQIKNGA